MAVKILLVDDNNDLGASVRQILKPEGYIIVEAADADNAVSLLAGETFDLVLLDITLPEKSGFKVLQYLNDHKVPSKVIVLTATHAMETTIKKAAENEWDFIVKPYSAEYLHKFIGHLLSENARTNHKLQIINAGAFIKSTPAGDLDMPASKQGLRQIEIAAAHLEGYTVLIDLRDVRSRLSTSNIYDLAAGMTVYGDTFLRKTAVLTRMKDDLTQAGFFETAARNRGFDVKAFTKFEEAVMWLSLSTRMTESPQH